MAIEMSSFVVEKNTGTTEYEIVDKTARETLETGVKNPGKLTITGIANGAYDGSEDVTIDFPIDDDVSSISSNPVKNSVIASLISEGVKNPNSLTFTGAATGTYDGSSSLTINIPTGETTTTVTQTVCPNSLIFTGAVDASYDGSVTRTVEIPQPGYAELSSEKLTAAASEWSCDLTTWGASNYTEIIVHVSGWHDSSGIQPLYLSMNGVENDTSYLLTDMCETTTLSTGSSILVGYLSGSASSNRGGLDIHMRLHSKGVTVSSIGYACTSSTNTKTFNCIGGPNSVTLITRSNLKNFKLFTNSDTVMLAAGAVITVYGRYI